jgi:hypothetical protein
MQHYTYDFFISKSNVDKSFREILDIQEDFSNISIDVLFNESLTPNEVRVKHALNRGIIRHTNMRPVQTIEELLSFTMEDFLYLRDMGRGGQILVLNSLLKYFEKGEIISDSDRTANFKIVFENYLKEMDVTEIREIAFRLFSEKSLNEQESFLINMSKE